MNEKAAVPGWPGWETVRLIGRGSFGSVYEIERDIFGVKEKAALKIISIPQNDSEITELYSDGYDSESITERFQEHLKDIVREYSLVAALKGHPNIVRCDDIRYVQHDDGIGWDIYIRMELLTPLMNVLPSVTDVGQAVQIGEDLCKALAECQKKNLIHRDIKPQNIFLSPNGDYKLGDFGIAKSVDRTTSGTKTGTYKYMAPEVYNNQPYGSAADIYSLGLTLYWLLNERRTPFLPLPPTKPRISEEDAARARRFRGEPLPAPAHGSEELKRIVLKACAYDPKDRYHTADEMLRDLNALGSAEKPQDVPAAAPSVAPPVEEAEEDKTVGAWTSPAAQPQPDEDKTVGAWAVPEEPAAEAAAQTEEDKTVGVWTQTLEAKKPEPAPTPAPTPKKTKKKKWWLAAVAAVAIVAVIAAIKLPSSNVVEISAGNSHTVGLKSNGTVVAVGSNSSGQCDVSGWRDITAVSTGYRHTVGLKSNGTVVAVGNYYYGQCNVHGWNDIVAVSTGRYHTVGLRLDGTVVAVGWNRQGQCNVSEWQDIVAISAGRHHTVGLKSDGTVVAVGENNYGQCDVTDWKDIVAVSAGGNHTVGLKSDGTVVVAGSRTYSEHDETEWKNITAVSAGENCTIGLKSYGTVVAVASNSFNLPNWTSIVAVSAGDKHFVGLKSNGTVVAVGDNSYGQCDVSDW